MEETTSREKILKKIRNALLNKSTRELPANIDFDTNVFTTSTDGAEIVFAQNFTEAGGKFLFCEDNVALIDNLDFLIKESNWKDGILCEEPILQELLNVAEVPYTKVFYDEIPIVFTTCECLIARTGSILLSSKQGSSKEALQLPQIHVVVAFTSQLVTDLKEGMNLVKAKYNGTFPNFITMLSNPIHEEDAINNRELIVFLIDEETE